MNPVFGPNHEDERRGAEANLLLLRVGLTLIDDSRRAGGFETDEVKLAARVGEIAESLGAESANAEEAPVNATPLAHDRALLSAPAGEHNSVSVVLRADGVLLEEYTGIGMKAEAVDTTELSPDQQEDLRQAQARFEARMRRARFRGERFLRVLTVEPRPGSAIQLLAVELFQDGLVVHHTFDQTPESIESIISSELSESLEPEPSIQVEDDLGTEYRNSGGGGGGVQVFHSAFAFVPAVPAAARSLRISSRGGTVELPL